MTNESTIQHGGLTSTQTAGKPRRKRVSTYTIKIAGRFLDHADEPQACKDRRVKLEAYAKELGFEDIEGSGFFASTMIDVPK